MILSGYSDHSSFGTFRSVSLTLLLDPTSRPFTKMAGTPRANGRDPLRVTLVGHSFIRRLRDFMNNSLEDNNLRLNREQYYVTCVARGGLTISRLCALREFTYFVARPNIVFIQIGGNDLCCSSPNIPKLAQEILSYAQYLLHGCNVQHVVIGQILRRNSQRVSATFNSEVVSLNLQLASACALHDNISFWKHRGFRASLDFLSSDGVHIREDMNGKYSRKYLQSIKSAILHVTQYL